MSNEPPDGQDGSGSEVAAAAEPLAPSATADAAAAPPPAWGVGSGPEGSSWPEASEPLDSQQPSGAPPGPGGPYGGAPGAMPPTGFVEGAPVGPGSYQGAGAWGGVAPGGPGAAIHAPAAMAAPPARSAAASTIGTLGIIFGSLIALGGGLHVGCRALLQGLQAPAAQDAEIVRVLQLEMGLWGLMVLLSVALIVIGVGVWRHRETARKAMLVWSVLALLTVGGRMATQAFVIQPETARVQRDLMARQHRQSGGPDPEQIMRMGRAWAIWGDLIIWAPFPVLALILLSRASVRERCS